MRSDSFGLRARQIDLYPGPLTTAYFFLVFFFTALVTAFLADLGGVAFFSFFLVRARDKFPNEQGRL